MDVARTPGLPDPSFEQVLASPGVCGGIACASDDASGDLVRGVWGCRALGFSFLTRGRTPVARRKPTRVEGAARESLAEGLTHSLFHVFGPVGGGLVRGLFEKRGFKARMREADEVLSNPRRFAIPWTALVAAEYEGDPVEIRLDATVALFDRLLLTEERDGSEQRHMLLVERTADAEGPTVPVSELFRHRAHFEHLSLVLALLAESADGNGASPFTGERLSAFIRSWSSDGGPAAIGALASELGVAVPGDELARRATACLARYPIAESLDPVPARGDGAPMPSVPDGELPFSTDSSVLFLAAWNAAEFC